MASESRVLENITNLPANLFEDSTYILGNALLQGLYSALNRAMPSAADGSVGDQVRTIFMNGLQDTTNFVYDSSRGCRATNEETAQDNFVAIPMRLLASGLYIPIFGTIDWLAKSIVGDNGSIESIYEAAADPNYAIKVALAQGTASVVKAAAWNGYNQTLAFRSFDMNPPLTPIRPPTGLTY